MKEIIATFRHRLEEMRIDDAIDKLLEANPIHDETGRFRKGKVQSGDVYSLSKKGAEKEGIDDKYIKRGVATGNVDDETGEIKTRSKFGMNVKSKGCGRRLPSGEDINPVYDCGDYSEKYSVNEADVLLDEDEEEQDKAYWRSTIRMAIKDEIQAALKSNSCSLSDITRALDAFSRSSKGKLVPDAPKD